MSPFNLACGSLSGEDGALVKLKAEGEEKYNGEKETKI